MTSHKSAGMNLSAVDAGDNQMQQVTVTNSKAFKLKIRRYYSESIFYKTKKTIIFGTQSLLDCICQVKENQKV